MEIKQLFERKHCLYTLARTKNVKAFIYNMDANLLSSQSWRKICKGGTKRSFLKIIYNGT